MRFLFFSFAGRNIAMATLLTLTLLLSHTTHAGVDAAAASGLDLPDDIEHYEDKYAFVGEWMCHKLGDWKNPTAKEVRAISQCLGGVLGQKWNNPYAMIIKACDDKDLSSDIQGPAYQETCYHFGLRTLWAFRAGVDEDLKADLLACQSNSGAKGLANSPATSQPTSQGEASPSVSNPPPGAASLACSKTYIRKLNEEFSAH